MERGPLAQHAVVRSVTETIEEAHQPSLLHFVRESVAISKHVNVFLLL